MSPHEPLEDFSLKERLQAKIASKPFVRRCLTYLVGVGLGIALLMLVSMLKGDPAEVTSVPTP